MDWKSIKGHVLSLRGRICTRAVPFQPWCTSYVKGKAQAEPQKRIERIAEDSEHTIAQRDHLC